MANALESSSRGRKNGHARSALKSRTNDVLDDISELRKDMGRLAEAASKAARTEVKTTRKRIGHIGRDIRTRVNSGVDQAADQVREHPAAALGISLGVGLLIGALLARR